MEWVDCTGGTEISTLDEHWSLDIASDIRRLNDVLIAATFAYCQEEQGSSKGTRLSGSISARLTNPRI
jgi:hypothetical protein